VKIDSARATTITQTSRLSLPRTSNHVSGIAQIDEEIPNIHTPAMQTLIKELGEMELVASPVVEPRSDHTSQARETWICHECILGHIACAPTVHMIF
jgi:hypothetical protein